ncbi:MAG: cupin domain-containing protein [Trueperaceae bacterium]
MTPKKSVLEQLPVENPNAAIERRRLTGERLELIDYRYQPGSTFPMHAHESEQLTVVLAGELVFVFEEGEERLQPGEALLIEGGRPHGAYVPAGASVTHTYNVFTPVRERPPG